METRNMILGAVGALVGAAGAIAAGYLFAPEASAQTTQAPSSTVLPAPPINITGGTNVMSFGQTGGVTAQTYVNQAPAPVLKIGEKGPWIMAGEFYQQIIFVRAMNANAAGKMRVTARGAGILNVGYAGEGLIENGEGDHGEGWAYMDSMTPTHVREIIVKARAPVEVQLEALFD